ncbi:MAG: DUF2851 family protein [Kiritimatiellae bacterium]|nr:DUF2851 family protein [Kiritimatiellia bacterium]MDD5520820.1 DUF2851 family protein [Kiritimatiellia bacterium]
MTKVCHKIYQSTKTPGKGHDAKPGLTSFFHKSRYYAGLINGHNARIREVNNSSLNFPYSERHLQCVWFDGSFRPEKLTSSTGEQVLVESPGRWNLEAGPDFLDAVLIIGPERRKMRGDIEIHIHPTDWKAHHHADDKAYSRLIAHVSYFSSQIPDETLPRGTIHISLRNVLRMNPCFSFESIDITAYPYSTFTSQISPCAEILSSWDPNNKAMLLESAGEERLRTKAFRMENSINERGADQVLYEEVLAALGYKYNSIAFRQLANVIPLNLLRKESKGDILKGYALLAGVSGLLPVKVSQKWDVETRSFVRQLWDYWWKNQSKWETRHLQTDAWRLSGLRPQNSPLRRMAAASSLFASGNSLATRLSKIGTTDQKSWHESVQMLFRPSDAMRYWNRRLSFSGIPQKSDITLVGTDRITAIKSNVFLPFLANRGIPVRKLLNNLPPEHDNNLIRLTAFALLGRDHNPSLYRNGLRQQGLIQIFHDFCINNRSACRNCPLPEALKSFNIQS